MAKISTLNSTKEEFVEKASHLSCTSDLPNMDRIITAYIAQEIFSKTPVDFLETSASNGVFIPMTMPDLSAMTKVKS